MWMNSFAWFARIAIAEGREHGPVSWADHRELPGLCDHRRARRGLDREFGPAPSFKGVRDPGPGVPPRVPVAEMPRPAGVGADFVGAGPGSPAGAQAGGRPGATTEVRTEGGLPGAGGRFPVNGSCSCRAGLPTITGRLPNSFRPANRRAGGVRKEDDETTKLNLRFDGPEIASGVDVDDLYRTVRRLRQALRRLLEHDPERAPREGRKRGWARRESAMRVGAAAPGSLQVPLAVGPAGGGPPVWRDFREATVTRLLDRADLPREVENELDAIEGGLSDAVASVRLSPAGKDGRLRNARPLEFRPRRKTPPTETAEESEKAILDGWLREVNWAKGTAQLHDFYGEEIIRLRFEPALADAIRRRANQFAIVRGRGEFDADGNWKVVRIEELRAPRSRQEPFDRKSLLDEPNPKIFDPDDVVLSREPFDVDEFLRLIRGKSNR